ncbi:MAG: alpha/beta fold hydrolase [Chlamydiota bacterium]
MRVNNLNFKPFLRLSSKHFQMVVSSCFFSGKGPPSKGHHIDLGEGDFLSCEISTPENFQANDPTVVLVHGLGGCHSSSYMIRMSRKIYFKGNKVVRINLRGCGSGKGLSKLPYNAGSSNDVLKVLQSLKQDAPSSEITVVGFSLGGNIALKLAGELGVEAKKLVKTFIAVCSPLDLAHTVSQIQEKRNRLYHYYYLKKICKQAKSWIFRDIRTLYEFDDLVTAPLWGYNGAAEYYKNCSSLQFLPDIRQSTHLLLAKDDPFVDLDKLQGVSLPDAVSLWITKQGGHMGFFGKSSKEHGPYWMDEVLINWIGGDFLSNSVADNL